MKRRFLLTTTLLALTLATAFAVEVIPPKPGDYFNDYAGVVSQEAALQFNAKLAQFERETSNQVVVAVFRKMESSSSVEDYAQRVAQAWGVGRKDRSRGNGVVLLAFIEDRKMSIQVGYGLEGALPDATAFEIRTRHINPHFRKSDYERGLAVGIELICKAIRGEYKGSGRTLAEGQGGTSPMTIFIILAIFVVIMIWAMRAGKRRKGYGYTRSGGPFVGGWPSGGWSSGGSSGGFGGFSGGGGGFGGGGSSGSW